MHGDHLRMIRERYGETQLQFGKRLGFEGSHDAVTRRVRRFEKGESEIVGSLAVLLTLLDKLGKKKADTALRSNLTATKGKA